MAYYDDLINNPVGYIEGNNFSDLTKYNGIWNEKSAAHLYRRTTFGATPEDIKEAASKSLDEIIEQILAPIELPPNPINYRFESDPNVPIGETWVNKTIERDGNEILIEGYRHQSLYVWQNNLLLDSPLHLREQMTLFWHNHFAIERVFIENSSFIFNYITTLRKHSLGNFKTLTKLITVDPAMLIYLNGDKNTKFAPNENFARELLELFTIGKGELQGPGDYTTFTEQDVGAASRVLTGWRNRGVFCRDGDPTTAKFDINKHDRRSKELSHRFDNAIIDDERENEYKTLIDIIFLQDEVAKFLCRKLYRWFVFYEINEEVERKIINPLADILRENNYDVKPVLKTLLSSQHFFDDIYMGSMIKNPITFLTGLLKDSKIHLGTAPDSLERYEQMQLIFGRKLNFGQMQYFSPPDVAGWKAYYQQPLFYRLWINSVTLRERQMMTDDFVSGKIEVNKQSFTVDILKYVEGFEDPLDPNLLIREFAAILFANPITEQQIHLLKEVLIPGLPDFEWTVEYSKYLDSPEDENMRKSVESKLRNLYSALLKMPEYYLT